MGSAAFSSSTVDTSVVVKPKAKTAKGARILRKREPQLQEGVKQAVFVRGTTTSQLGMACMHSLYALKKQHSVMLSKRNDLHPFDFGKNEQALEFLMQRNDSPLLCLHTHSKKRPNTLTFVRTYDHHLYDMYELSITQFHSLQDVCAKGSDAWTPGEKPAMLFSGEAFHMDDRLSALKMMFLDFFRGVPVDSLDVSGLRTVMHFVASADGKQVMLRVHRVRLTTQKEIELTPLGPFVDFSIGRMKLPSDEQHKHAHRVAKQLAPKKQKNVTTNATGGRFGRIHVGRQEINKLQTRKVKALRQPKKSSAAQ